MLTGSLPNCLSNCTALESIDYSSTSDHGNFMGAGLLLDGNINVLCSLMHLTTILFQYTYALEGTIPACLGINQPDISVIAIQGNFLTSVHGTIPETVCGMKKLTYLNLMQTDSTGVYWNNMFKMFCVLDFCRSHFYILYDSIF